MHPGVAAFVGMLLAFQQEEKPRGYGILPDSDDKPPATASAKPLVRMSTAAVAQQARQAVVHITVEGIALGRTGAQFEQEPFGMRGTGFFIDNQGHIVTNAHVVRPDRGRVWMKPPRVKVVWSAEKDSNVRVTRLEGRIVGRDDLSDLAVLKVDYKGTELDMGEVSPLLAGRFAPMEPLEWSDSVEIGDDVVVVGFPFGMAGGVTVSKGIVSNTNRTLDPDFAGYIQTDAAINGGNSGGPLLDTFGRVVGVNTFTRRHQAFVEIPAEAIRRLAEGKSNESLRLPVEVDVAQSIGFARSYKTARRYVEMMIRDGQVTRRDLGARFESHDARIDVTFRDMYVPKDTPPLDARGLDMERCVKVVALDDGSPLAAAGVKVDDLIFRIEDSNSPAGERILGIADVGLIDGEGALNDLLATKDPGAVVNVYWYTVLPGARIQAHMAQVTLK